MIRILYWILMFLATVLIEAGSYDNIERIKLAIYVLTA
jgi:hypothetical protein